MKVTWQGRDYQLDMGDVDVRDMMAIQAHTGLTWRRFALALVSEAGPGGEVTVAASDRPEFLMGLVGAHWLMLRQAGENVPIEQVRFGVGEFATAYYAAAIEANEAAQAAAGARPGAEEEEGPTLPAGSAPSPEPTTARPRRPRGGGGASPGG